MLIPDARLLDQLSNLRWVKNRTLLKLCMLKNLLAVKNQKVYPQRGGNPG